MTGCSRWGHEVGAYLDGEITPPELASFEAHLPTCEPCRRALEAQHWLSNELAGLPQVETSAQFEAGFWARTARDQARARARSGWARWFRLPALGWGLGAAGLAAAVFLAYPRPVPLPDVEWPIVAESEEFELTLDTDPQLLEVLDVLEAWDDS
jgi:anti-sigma factor RsiW